VGALDDRILHDVATKTYALTLTAQQHVLSVFFFSLIFFPLNVQQKLGEKAKYLQNGNKNEVKNLKRRKE